MKTKWIVTVAVCCLLAGYLVFYPHKSPVPVKDALPLSRMKQDTRPMAVSEPTLSSVKQSPTRSEVGGVSDEVKPQEPQAHANGNVNRISNHFQARQLTKEEAKKMAESMNLSDEEKKKFADKEMEIIEPADPDEKRIPFHQLESDCPALSQVKGILSLHISGAGNVVEAIPLKDTDQIPESLYSCVFRGGPAENFTSVYVPGH
jgi:hypothetical protein